MGPGDLRWPQSLEGGIGKFARSSMIHGPDFSDIDHMFGNMMSNPTMMARGGNWIDPMQAQQQATSGYLSNRGGIAENFMQQLMRMAGLAESAGSAKGQIAGMIPRLEAIDTSANSSLFGNLLGGMV
jgi:hypothetical protein